MFRRARVKPHADLQSALEPSIDRDRHLAGGEGSAGNASRYGARGLVAKPRILSYSAARQRDLRPCRLLPPRSGAGSAIGSLLNVSFGTAAELVLALFVLSHAQTQVVQAQITGSIIGATLLFLGVAVLVGGVRHKRQFSSKAQVGLLSTLLLLTVAILLPATFDMTERLTSPGANLSGSVGDQHVDQVSPEATRHE